MEHERPEFGQWAGIEIGGGDTDEQWTRVVDAETTLKLHVISLKSVNTYVNKLLTYKGDKEDRDYWQTPRETEALKTGDCEDYCILKRALLMKLGYRDEDILFLIVRDKLRAGRGHAILMYQNYVLDMHLDKVIPWTEALEYKPVLGYIGRQKYIFGKKVAL